MPLCTPVVLPLRLTAWPTQALPADVMSCEEPLYRSTVPGWFVYDVLYFTIA